MAGNAGASVARRVFRRIPGANLLDTGLQLAETYNSDAPPEQKLEGYGTAVGGLGGGLAGAAAGAAIGSVVPVIGTAIGGLIGGVLGSMGGESIGGWLGKALGSGKEELAAKPGLGEAARVMDSPAPQPPLPAPPVATATPAVPPAPINQQFTFTANMPVTFSNSLDDPSVLQQLEAIARRQLEELMRQARSAQLADTPHIAL
ncbi:tail tape measure protein [Pseudomonas sp. DrBHI1]|nr:tail tape measure protein [Pseudomonas sp. DrBHI1]